MQMSIDNSGQASRFVLEAAIAIGNISSFSPLSQANAAFNADS
jgi:hypothetical protein